MIRVIQSVEVATPIAACFTFMQAQERAGQRAYFKWFAGYAAPADRARFAGTPKDEPVAKVDRFIGELRAA